MRVGDRQLRCWLCDSPEIAAILNGYPMCREHCKDAYTQTRPPDRSWWRALIPPRHVVLHTDREYRG